MNKKINNMKSLEFKTTVHNGIIEIPKDNPQIKDKEVNVIILWDEKPVKEKPTKKSPAKKITGNKKKKELTEFQKYLLSWPEMSDEEYNYIQEKRKHFNEWK